MKVDDIPKILTVDHSKIVLEFISIIEFLSGNPELDIQQNDEYSIQKMNLLSDKTIENDDSVSGYTRCDVKKKIENFLEELSKKDVRRVSYAQLARDISEKDKLLDAMSDKLEYIKNIFREILDEYNEPTDKEINKEINMDESFVAFF